MTGYQCIGWYKNIKPEDRKRTTLSDGAIFSCREFAVEYAEKHFSLCEIREIQNPTITSLDMLAKKEFYLLL